MSTVISVENLGKKYTLQHQQRDQYTNLRDVLTESVKNAGRRLTHLFSHSPIDSPQSQALESFWALKDVSFEVKQGDRIGVIGRNGAGKSTLLKILSRITEPTTGSVRIKGRVASLLEVGTGFHPELTGRENIFLNGAILGMSRVEIKNKFDEIIDFAEIEKFLDTPVKRYSSGMYVRLAFAVAAHLEPEILVVDEVLAVGDAQFQKKCLGKMEDVSTREGRTVLFVSHNLVAIKSLCNQALLLEHGKVAIHGNVNSAINGYLDTYSAHFQSNSNKSEIAFEYVGVVNSNGTDAVAFSYVDDAYLNVLISSRVKCAVYCGITIYNNNDEPLFSSPVLNLESTRDSEELEYRLRIPVELLPSATYRVEGAIWDAHNIYDQSELLCCFTVLRPDCPLEIGGGKPKGYLMIPGAWQRI